MAVFLPTLTGNYVDDICRWIKEEGCVVRVFNSSTQKSGLVYHQCMKKAEGKKEKSSSLKTLQVVWVNFMDVPKLLGEGGWPAQLKTRGCQFCKCAFAKKIANGELVGQAVYGFKIAKMQKNDL
jgi:hypothetical protein